MSMLKKSQSFFPGSDPPPPTPKLGKTEDTKSSLFGAPKKEVANPTGLFASKTTTGGQSTTASSTGGGLFGGGAKTSGTTGLFGSKTETSGTSTGLFGSKPATTGGFGSTASKPSTGLFGGSSTTASTSSGGGLFGQKTTSAPTLGQPTQLGVAQPQGDTNQAEIEGCLNNYAQIIDP